MGWGSSQVTEAMTVLYSVPLVLFVLTPAYTVLPPERVI